MSRQSPTGFAFSMLIEVAAVVIIVSLLPRFDLRPKANAATSNPPDLAPPSLLTSFARPSFNDTFNQRSSLAPPLVESPPIDHKYVEERLDRASQQLVNSVGSAVTQVASNLAQSVQPAALQPAAVPPPGWNPPLPERQVTLRPQPSGSNSPATSGSFPTQPRPWLRY